MKPLLSECTQGLAQLFFPVICPGCGTDRLNAREGICRLCLHKLPATGFENFADNPVEKVFWGRLPVEAASSQFYFSKSSLLQQLLHQLKYQGKKEIGLWLGAQMGKQLKCSGRFQDIDLIIPVPLHKKRLRQRGYNQAEWICRGLASPMNLPVNVDTLQRSTATRSQTRMNREKRWQNIRDRFRCRYPDRIANRHVLLVDDVITTGATLEAAGEILRQIPGVKLSIASLAYTAI